MTSRVKAMIDIKWCTKKTKHNMENDNFKMIETTCTHSLGEEEIVT